MIVAVVRRLEPRRPLLGQDVVKSGSWAADPDGVGDREDWALAAHDCAEPGRRRRAQLAATGWVSRRTPPPCRTLTQPFWRT